MVTAVAVYVAAALVVLAVGPRMARSADALAQATGMGGALFGVVFLALATDLPELALTPTAVLTGSPKIAVGGLLGSAAAQLLMVAVVDVAFRRGRLPGQVAQISSLAQCALMMAVLAVPLLAVTGGPTFGGAGLGTALLPLTYLGVLAGIRGLDADEQLSPAASPAPPPDGRSGPRERANHASGTRRLWLRFGAFALVLMGAGVALEATTETIGSTLGLEQTAAGALLAGIAQALPELVTATAAARAGALELAVGDLVGSSALDVALLSLADGLYTAGSLFELFGRAEVTLIGVILGLTALLVVGLVRREPVGSPRVAVETPLMFAVYGLGVALLI